MKKSELRGFKDVFSFTFLQTLRTKSFLITMIIMILIMFGMSPVMSLVSGGKDKKSPVEKVYVSGENIAGIPFENSVKDDENFSDIVFEKLPADTDMEKFEAELTDSSDKTVLLKYEITEDGFYMLNALYPSGSKLNSTNVNDLAVKIKDWYSDYKVSSLNIPEETLNKITKEIKVKEIEVDKFLKPETKEKISQKEYQLVYGMLFIAYMVIIMSANMVGGKIVEEKTNRIVEYLMTTVRPMALILGKVVAMLLVTVGEMSLMLVAAVCGNKLAKALFGSNAKSAVESFIPVDAVKYMSVPNVILCIFIIGVGILIYALLAGLFAATVSKMEELQQGMKGFNIIMIGSFLVAFMALQFMWTIGINPFVKFTLYFPFTSVFVLPGSIFIGKAPFVMVLVACILMLLTAFVILWFVGLVYESIIVANGAPISVKQMIGIAKGSMKKGKEVKK